MMELAVIKIRFNTNYPYRSRYKWRVIEIRNENWKEHLANEIVINTISQTTTDILDDRQTIKHHITTKAKEIIFEGEGTDGFDKIIIGN